MTALTYADAPAKVLAPLDLAALRRSFSTSQPPSSAGVAAAAHLRAGPAMALVSVDAAGRVVADLPVLFEQRIVGDGRVALRGHDVTGVLAVNVTAHTQTGLLQTNLHYELDGSQRAVRVYRVLRFIRTLRGDARLAFTLNGEIVGKPAPIPADHLPVDDEAVDAIRAFAFAQSVTGNEAPLPLEIGPGDRAMLAELEALLRGATITGRWRALAIERRPDDNVEQIAEYIADGAALFEYVEHMSRTVAGVTFDVGDVLFTFAAVQLAEEQVEGSIGLEPALDNNTFTARMVDPPAISLRDPFAPPVELDAGLLKAARRSAS